jgi:serine/threonine protein kinase
MTVSSQPTEQDAARIVERFVRRFDESYRLLACHAALPLVLTPELVHYLRNTFLRGEVPWVAEADLLLSDLCGPVGYEQFAMPSAVRAYLMKELRVRVGEQRFQNVARLLIRYVHYLQQSGSLFSNPELHAQQLAAMVCLDDQREQAAREITESLEQNVTAEAESTQSTGHKAEIARLAQLTRELAPQLEAYPELVEYADLVGRIVADPERTIAEEGERALQSRQVLGRELAAPAVLAPQEPWFSFGKYTVFRKLGEGGFATVYQATDSTLKRDVALKIPHQAFLSDQTFVQRFQQETQIVASLEHPNIVKIYDYGEESGRLFVAMTLGMTSLAEYIRVHGALSFAKTLELIDPVCAALDYVHSQGVIHRDLKPANILLDDKDNPLLTDFGFARLFRQDTMSMSLNQSIAGTPAYIPPEIWDDEASSVQSDIYALGCILYEMLNSEVLFSGQTPMQAMRAHDKGPKFPSQWSEGVPYGIEDVLQKALARNPAERYQSAGAFWQALDDLSARSATGTWRDTTKRVSQIFQGDRAGDEKSVTGYYRPTPSRRPNQPTTPVPNPFGKRGRIDNPAEFFGREELLRRIFEELDKGNNLSLIGERQIGKSSLLSMIEYLAHERLNSPPDAVLSIDMQIIHSEEDFFEALCSELEISPVRGYRLLRALRGKHYILCLDEIEKMKRDTLTVNARAELRGLADGARAPFTLVIASRKTLNELFADKDDGTSPLYNICTPIIVPPFSHDEARAFIAVRLQGTGVQFSEDEIVDLLEQSQCHPARLQQAAAELYRRHTERRYDQ